MTPGNATLRAPAIWRECRREIILPFVLLAFPSRRADNDHWLCRCLFCALTVPPADGNVRGPNHLCRQYYVMRYDEIADHWTILQHDCVYTGSYLMICARSPYWHCVFITQMPHDCEKKTALERVEERGERKRANGLDCSK